MNWLKKIFGPKTKRVRTDYENMLLNRLEKHRIETRYCDGKTFYTDDDKTIFKVKVLGRYEYEDVDGLVGGTVVEKEDGEITQVNFNFLYEKKPHDWVIYLSTYDRSQYCSALKYYTDEELTNKFLNSLPKEVVREIKINSLLN